MSKKRFRIILSVLLLLCISFLSFKWLSFFSVGNTDVAEVFEDKQKIYGNEKCYCNDKYLYVVNEKYGIVHIFLKNGDFISRIQVPTGGGVVYSGINDSLYIYSIRESKVTEITNNQVVAEYDNSFNDIDDFFESYNIGGTIFIELTGNIVTIYEKDQTTKIKLDIDVEHFNMEMCFVLLVTCFFLFLWSTGLLRKLTN